MDYLVPEDDYTSELLADVSVSMLATADRPTHTPNQVVQIVLRGVCGFEPVAELCEREGITQDQFQQWRELFMRACEDWTQTNLPLGAAELPHADA